MLNKQAQFVIEQLNNNGFECFVVGGAIRDYLLGLPIHDYDFTTNATPSQIKEVFSHFTLLNKGEKHGTIGVLIDDKVYEITTYRIDGDYLLNRKPEKVEFSLNLSEDLARRDFTINSVCYCPRKGFIDVYNGINDIENKIIKTVGDSVLRFNEDALRILRALRFSSILGFEIEEETANAIFKTKGLLQNVSKERIYSELCKILIGKNASKVLEKFKYVLFEIIPELEKSDNFEQISKSHTKNVFEHTLWVIDNCENNLVLRLAALFHDSGKPYSYQDGSDGYRHYKDHWDKSAEIAKTALTRLRAPKSVIKQVELLCKHHDADLVNKVEIKELLNVFGIDLFNLLLKHKLADVLAHSQYGIDKYLPYLQNTEKLYDEIIKNGECYKISQLNFNGSDALNLGLDGQVIGEILLKLYKLVINEKIENNFECLKDYVIRNFVKN